MNRFACGVMLFMLSGLLASCSFHKRVAGKKAKSVDKTVMQGADSNRVASSVPHAVLPPPDTIAVAAAPDTSAIVKKLISDLTPMWNRRLTYKTFSGKARVHYETPDNKQEFTANFRVKKDSIIWIAITFIGVPAARVYITPDSLFMINYIDKEVTLLGIADMAKLLPTKVDFASLQRLLTGEPLRDGTITDVSVFGGSWSLHVEDSSYIQQITYNKADSTIRTAQLRTRDPKGPQAMMEFGNYEISNNRKIATGRVLNIQNGDSTYSVDMNFLKTEFDEPLEYPFSIPKNYLIKNPNK